ncbi:hypothetical protein [uncultured Rikenella sp.]|nr:hypothetical protein [uncultured Rikenella sp.]
MHIGNSGFSWTFSASNTRSLDLYLNVTWLDPSSSGYRGYGFQLRCLSE